MTRLVMVSLVLASTIMTIESSAQETVDTARVVTVVKKADVTLYLEHPILRADSIAIRRVAARLVGMEKDTSAAFPRFGIHHDTVFVPTWVEPKHIGFTTVRVLYSDGKWVGISRSGLGMK